jgi:hypothetical protein
MYLVFLTGGFAGAQTAGGDLWTPATDSATFQERYSHSSVVFNKGDGDAMWVIGGNSVSSGLFNDVWLSKDGITWTPATDTAQFLARADHTSVVFQNRIWVIGGYGGARTFNDVWYSSDGVLWKEATGGAAFPVRYGHSSVVFNNKIWVIGGSGDSGDYYNDVWYSSDGVTWTPATNSAPFPPRYSHTSVVYDNKIWVIGGYNAQAGNLNDVWYSSDGILWKEANNSALWPARGDHTSVVFGHRMWVMGGSGDSGNFQDVWYSSDGKLWAPATEAAQFPARTCHSSVLLDKKVWLISGWGDEGNLHDVWYSPVPVVPEITGITPVSGPNTSPLSITGLMGSDFMTGARVSLNRTGTADIAATDTTILSPTSISCMFDLTGKPPGTYNVVVTNPDGQQGVLRNGFTIVAPSADMIANTTINGLVISNCGGLQTLTIDTGILGVMAEPGMSVLELQPPGDRGFKKIVIYAPEGTGFNRSGTIITGRVGRVHMETGEISPSGISPEVGTLASTNYSIDLSLYPCNAVLRTTVWENAMPDDQDMFRRIAEVNNARYLGTAYTTKITRTNFPSPDNVTLRMSLNSSWDSLSGNGNGRIFIERISDDRKSGAVLPTRLQYHDSHTNLDYFETDSLQGLSTFGLSSISGNDTPYQVVRLEDGEGNDPVENNSSAAIAGIRVNPVPLALSDLGQTANLTHDENGAVTRAITLLSTDCLARVNIAKGTRVNGSNGTPLSSIVIKAVAAENLPGLSSGTGSSFAGRVYELLPEGTTLSPEIPVTFIAPHIPSGQEFLVKTYDRGTGTWSDIPTRYDPETASITVQVTHFSILALFSQNAETGSGSVAGTNPPAPGADSMLQSIPGTLTGAVSWAIYRIIDNIIIIFGIAVIIAAIFFRTRRPRRYRVIYEK